MLNVILLNVILLNVIMLSVVMLNVIMLSVMSPFKKLDVPFSKFNANKSFLNLLNQHLHVFVDRIKAVDISKFLNFSPIFPKKSK
jgi:hypothetical protein